MSSANRFGNDRRGARRQSAGGDEKADNRRREYFFVRLDMSLMTRGSFELGASECSAAPLNRTIDRVSVIIPTGRSRLQRFCNFPYENIPVLSNQKSDSGPWMPAAGSDRGESPLGNLPLRISAILHTLPGLFFVFLHFHGRDGRCGSQN